MFVAVFVCISILVVCVQGSLECLCATVELQITFDKGPPLLPKDKCAGIVDDVKGVDGSVWYKVNYNNQSGWIQADTSMMSILHCTDINISTTTALPTTTSPCRDMDGINCQWLDAGNNICSDKASAQQFCPKYCKICDKGVTSILGR
ncbi:uncharacterized protein [Haliotis cracherodii]|uniref:uncharacterized protein n=1 Tax=Haliotis cracherodii TaxID=6455 RepID=UPI0039EAAF87